VTIIEKYGPRKVQRQARLLIGKLAGETPDVAKIRPRTCGIRIRCIGTKGYGLPGPHGALACIVDLSRCVEIVAVKVKTWGFASSFRAEPVSIQMNHVERENPAATH
jgi:hypothetical protein